MVHLDILNDYIFLSWQRMTNMKNLIISACPDTLLVS